MNSDKRTIGLILVIITGVLCACPGFLLMALGALMGVMGIDPATRLEVYETSDWMPAALMCVCGLVIGTFMIAIPVLIGLVTLRRDKSEMLALDEPLPPAI